MKTILMSVIVLAVTMALTSPAPADVVVLKNGRVYIGKVSFGDSGRLKLSAEYGDQFFPRDEVAGYFLTPKGMEAEGYYQAGLVVLGKGQTDTARQLFERSVKYDASYQEKCVAALKGGPSALPPTSGAARGTPGPTTTVIAPPRPQGELVRVQCPGCTGTGVIMFTSRLKQESGAERPRPCPTCGGKGFRDLRIPPGYQLCSGCSGFGGTVSDTGRSDTSSFTIRKTMCGQCAGRGLVKAPWKPPEETGLDTSGSGPISYSPAPGTEPRPTGVQAIARDRAKSVASGTPATRPIGPSGIRPVSPTILEDPSSADPASGSYEESPPAGEEEVLPDEDDSGGSSDSGSNKDIEEDSSSSSDYEYRGFIGKINKYKWYIVLAGCGLLVFAIVFNRMSGKK